MNGGLGDLVDRKYCSNKGLGVESALSQRSGAGLSPHMTLPQTVVCCVICSLQRGRSVGSHTHNEAVVT